MDFAGTKCPVHETYIHAGLRPVHSDWGRDFGFDFGSVHFRLHADVINPIVSQRSVQVDKSSCCWRTHATDEPRKRLAVEIIERVKSRSFRDE